MSTQSRGLFARLAQGSLVKQILVGLVLGILLAMVSKPAAEATGLLGTLFVGALKAVAPVLVLMLVMASIANHQHGQKTNIRPILFLYLLGTFSAALTAVVFSFLFPSTLHLTSAAGDVTPPSGIVEVLRGLLMSMVSNPITALMNANYIGILVWAIGLGFALRHGNETTKNLVNDVSNAVTFMVKIVIRFAPIGIFGLVSSTLATTGFDALWGYAQLLIVLVGCMLLVALVVNPLLVFWQIRRNPYPLVMTCLRESGVYAFFTRSSAANIPVNMALAEKLNLDRDTYSVSIPLGATVNMAGAAITVTVLTLAAVHTLGIAVQVQLLRQRHVDRNVRRRAAGEEGIHAALAQAGQHQRKRVAADLPEHQQRVDHQRHQQHTADQHNQQLRVTPQCVKTGSCQRGGDQPENTDWRKANHQLHHKGHGVGQIVDQVFRRLVAVAQREAQTNRPDQDTNVVSVHQRGDGVRDHAHQQAPQDFDNPGRRRDITGRAGQVQRGREQEAKHHGR